VLRTRRTNRDPKGEHGDRQNLACTGAVTRTEFGRTKIGKPDSDSGRSGGSPRPESFRSEGPELAAGCEMALNVENVLDGGVNGQEALG
jgi:hypothetical protein